MSYLRPTLSTTYASPPPTTTNVSSIEPSTTYTTYTTTDCVGRLITDLASNASSRLLQQPPPPVATLCNATLFPDEAGGGGMGPTKGDTEPFLFDRSDVRGVLIALYTAVFITGFVGNLVVLLVMWVHPRMRSTTNFFLTNLAIADFCVTVFCVYQNLSLYLAQTWVFGDFLCKMYNFVNYLSYTASVMILVVNCVERYVAIMCPFRAKTLLRHRNLVVLLLLVWAGSGVYCCPRLLYFRAGSHELPGAQYTEVICLADRELYDSRTFDTINFVLLYVMPLSVMSLLYWRIGRYLWVNGRQIEEARRNATQGPPLGTLPSESPCCSSAMKENTIKNQQPRSREDGQIPQSGACSSSSFGCCSSIALRRRWRQPGDTIAMGPYHSERLIRTWRKVVKLLVAVVLCFAICNLPFHLRKMLTYYHPAYKPTTNAALMFTPLSNLLMYLNSALNPIVYSFMSHNFRACVRDVLTRYTRRGKRRHLSGPQRSAPRQRPDPQLHILAATNPHPRPHSHPRPLPHSHPCSISRPRLEDHHP